MKRVLPGLGVRIFQSRKKVNQEQRAAKGNTAGTALDCPGLSLVTANVVDQDSWPRDSSSTSQTGPLGTGRVRVSHSNPRLTQISRRKLNAHTRTPLPSTAPAVAPLVVGIGDSGLLALCYTHNTFHDLDPMVRRHRARAERNLGTTDATLLRRAV